MRPFTRILDRIFSLLSDVSSMNYGYSRALAPLLSLALAAGCHRAASPASTAARPSPVTFNKDVAPILFEHCATCHRPVDPEAPPPKDQWCFAGAPFSLLDYRDAHEHAKEIAEATRQRVMPPWLPEPTTPDFVNARRLRDDQIALIQQWVEQGALEGAAADKPPPPKWA